MNFSKIRSYAKLNLALNVIGKSSSDLHRVESLITFVKLYDLIYLRPIKLSQLITDAINLTFVKNVDFICDKNLDFFIMVDDVKISIAINNLKTLI